MEKDHDTYGGVVVPPVNGVMPESKIGLTEIVNHLVRCLKGNPNEYPKEYNRLTKGMDDNEKAFVSRYIAVEIRLDTRALEAAVA